MDEHALWADLDEVNPSAIDSDLRPTVAWETSPGSYQALWVAGSGDFLGASWPGNENHRLTYHLGADLGGWFTTKLLRLPGSMNHKPERTKNGKPAPGKILWTDGPVYHPGDFSDLPEVKGAHNTINEALESEIDGVDRHQVLARVKLKLPHRARELLGAREISGDRSDQQWWLTRCLADVGCTVAEIVAILHALPWNKFADRSNEIQVLISEASKAISLKSQKDEEDGESDEIEEVERPAPQRMGALLRNVKKPKFIVDGVLSVGACGFIAGEPKSFKSWCGLDLAYSVATGADFLGHFRVLEPGPVFYIQEEDPLPTLKDRSAKIWRGKTRDKLELEETEGLPTIMWLPPSVDKDFDPDVSAYVQHGFTLSDEAWMLWLDEQLEQGLDRAPYKLLIVDTLMMTAGEVEETRSQEMTTKIFRPLKVLSRKYDIAVILVHHLGKGEKPRAGQRMLGSVANHAWAEDSIYLLNGGLGKDIRMEIESKQIPGAAYRLENMDTPGQWDPQVSSWRKQETTSEQPRERQGARRSATSSRARAKQSPAQKTIDELGRATTRQVAEAAKITQQQAYRQLARLKDLGKIVKDGEFWSAVIDA